MPAELQHAMRFRKRALDARHVADAERDGHGVEGAVGERQRLGVALDERHDIVEPALGGARAADLEHGVVDVGDGDAGRVIAGVHHPERDVAGAAGHIEQRERTVSGARRVHRRHQHVLPGAMQAGRHQVVHQVVAAGDRMEHVVDQRLLVAKRHVTEAEMGVVGHAGGTIARGWRRGYVRRRCGKSNRIRVDLSRPRTT